MNMVTNQTVQNEPRALRAQLAFVTWLKQTHPAVYADAVGMSAERDGTVSGLFDSLVSGISKIDFGKLADGAMKAGTGLLALKSQKNILKLNLDRAKQGLPPLDAAEYGQAPVIRTQIELEPEIAGGLAAGFREMQLPLLLGLGGLLAFLVLRRSR